MAGVPARWGRMENADKLRLGSELGKIKHTTILINTAIILND